MLRHFDTAAKEDEKKFLTTATFVIHKYKRYEPA